MAKPQGNDCYSNYVVDPELQRLFNKRAKTKDEVDVDIKFISPTLAVGLEDAGDLVDNAIEVMEAHMEDLKLAHREYVKKILEDISRDEKEMSIATGKCNEYLKEVLG